MPEATGEGTHQRAPARRGGGEPWQRWAESARPGGHRRPEQARWGGGEPGGDQGRCRDRGPRRAAGKPERAGGGGASARCERVREAGGGAGSRGWTPSGAAVRASSGHGGSGLELGDGRGGSSQREPRQGGTGGERRSAGWGPPGHARGGRCVGTDAAESGDGAGHDARGTLVSPRRGRGRATVAR
nr:glycine-rich cell wall structural protein 1.0-like [Aegilops tauschii subsp. strangulata]